MGNTLQEAVDVAVARAVKDILSTAEKTVREAIVMQLSNTHLDGLVSLADTLPQPGELHRAPYDREAKFRGRPPKQLSVKEAADRLGVTVRVVYSAMEKGKLKFREVKVPEGTRGPRNGKLRVISLEDLNAWRSKN